LEELSFEGGTGGSAVAPMGTGGGEGPYVTPGDGDLEDTDTAERPDDGLTIEALSDSFPSTWPKDTLFAVEQGNAVDPYYFAYEPSQHRLSVLQLVEGEDLIYASPWAPDRVWTHLAAVSSSTGPVLVGYDATSGIVEYAHGFGEDGTFEVTRSAGNHHTQLLVWPLDEWRLLFGYDKTTGFYRGVGATSEDDAPVLQGTIEAGWSAVTAIRYGEEPALLFRSPDSGQFALYRPTADGIELMGQGAFGPKLDVITWPALPTLAVYEPGTGEVELGSLEEGAGGAGGAGGHFVTSWFNDGHLRYLRRELTWIGSFELPPSAAVLSFDEEVLSLNFPLLAEEEHILR